MGQSTWSKNEQHEVNTHDKKDKQHEKNKRDKKHEFKDEDEKKDTATYIVKDESLASVTRMHHEREMIVGCWSKGSFDHKSIFICYFSDKNNDLIGRAFSIELFYDDHTKKSVLSIKGPIYNTTARKYKCKQLFTVYSNMNNLIEFAKQTIEQHGEYGYWTNNCRHFADKYMESIKQKCLISLTNIKVSVVSQYIQQYVDNEERGLVEAIASINFKISNMVSLTWETDLFLNTAHAMAFACVECKKVPIECWTNKVGNILCFSCCDFRKDVKNVAVQNMINKLKIKCLNRSSINESEMSDEIEEKRKNDLDEVEGNVVDTNANVDGCDWTGMIQEWHQHEKQCLYKMLRCKHCQAQCKRDAMFNHQSVCPSAVVECPLQCGTKILRKDIDAHLVYYCTEKILNCINPGCTIQINRKNYEEHVNNECNGRGKSNKKFIMMNSKPSEDKQDQHDALPLLFSEVLEQYPLK